MELQPQRHEQFPFPSDVWLRRLALKHLECIGLRCADASDPRGQDMLDLKSEPPSLLELEIVQPKLYSSTCMGGL